MKKVLIIGGTGFLGSHLCNFLKRKKFKIDVICQNKVKKKIPKISYYIVNIEDKKKLEKKLRKKNYSFIFNFGGNIDHKNKKKVFRSHYIGLKNLLNIFSKKKIQLFVQIGSSMEYGKKFPKKKEGMMCLPRSHYGCAKLEATKLCIKKFKEENFPVVVLRLFQIYGPNQKTNRLIPYVINKCLNEKKFNVTEGKQYRDFLYIDDLISLIYKLISSNKKITGEIFNVGYGKPIQIKKIVEKIVSIIKTGKPRYGKIKIRKEEQNILYPNVKKILRIFNWKAKVGIDDGLRKTINSYKVY